jgi:hypothetical protein
MIPDIIISITKTESSGIHPPFGKMYIRRNRYMNKDYPNIVCLECLNEAWEDTKKYDNRTGIWSGAYSVYGGYCEVCEQDKDECTEPRDAGYPNFDYVKQRLRAKKIKKIIDNTDG